MSRPCLIEGCTKLAGVPGTGHGWCSMHYSRWKRTGDPLTIRRTPQRGVCSVDGCAKQRWARGFCSMHLYRWRRTGDPGGAEPTTAKAEGICRIEDCGSPVRYGIHRLCQGHYLRQLRYGDPMAGAASPGHSIGCSFDGCDGKHYARGMCERHWRKVVGNFNREARFRSAEGHATVEQIRARVAYFGDRCWMCGEPWCEIDHVKPLAKGGSNWPSNLRPACKPCNRGKRAQWEGVAALRKVA